MTYKEFKYINYKLKKSKSILNYCRIKRVDFKNDSCIVEMFIVNEDVSSRNISITNLIESVLRGSGYITNPSMLTNYNFSKFSPQVNHKTYLKAQKDLQTNEEEKNCKLRDEVLQANEFLLYHGSDGGLHGEISCKRNIGACDFGSGFYTGDNLNQAENRVSNKKDAYLYTFKFDAKDYSVFDFKDDIVLWALYVGYNRGYITIKSNYYLTKFNKINKSDIIVGYIADDKISYVFRDFLDGNITDTCLAECLKLVKYGKQYVFKTQSAIDACLKLYKSYKLTTEMKKASVQWSSTLKNNLDAQLAILKKKYRGIGKFIDEYI